MMFRVVLSSIIGYLLGSVNTSIIVGKLFFKTDIREQGSGNAGATNAFRTLGKGAAAAVLAGDFLKGVISCLLGRYLGGELIPGVYAGEYAAGLFAVLGHNWPVYFDFKGGKGVLTSFAVLLMFSPMAALICLAAFILIVALTRYVSLGSIIGAAIFPVAAYFCGGPSLLIAVGTFLASLIIIRHRANIQRLLEGSEKKLNFKQKK
ncbi:MAG TPA: acyl-phosphate glycerol 3-phosphate acyltransferase [Ruminiclostridium sp.]|nr:acyl-phosphate glycerol 3-phosphate acyltransferase [Ruminiclostridium sp.]